MTQVRWRPDICKDPLPGPVLGRRLSSSGGVEVLVGKSWISRGLLEMDDNGEIEALRALVAQQAEMIGERDAELAEWRAGPEPDCEDAEECRRAYDALSDRVRDVLAMLTGSERPSITDCGGDGPIYRLALQLDEF